MLPGCFLSHVPLSSRAPSSGHRVAQHRSATICRFKVRNLQPGGVTNGAVWGACISVSCLRETMQTHLPCILQLLARGTHCQFDPPPV